jgi:hypothetical protein
LLLLAIDHCGQVINQNIWWILIVSKYLMNTPHSCLWRATDYCGMLFPCNVLLFTNHYQYSSEYVSDCCTLSPPPWF